MARLSTRHLTIYVVTVSGNNVHNFETRKNADQFMSTQAYGTCTLRCTVIKAVQPIR